MDKFNPTSLPDVPDIPASIIESGIADEPVTHASSRSPCSASLVGRRAA